MDISNLFATGDGQSIISILLIIVVAIPTFFIIYAGVSKSIEENKETEKKNKNTAKREKNTGSGNYDKIIADWRCLNCGENNKSRNMKCKKCGHFR